MTKSPSLLAFLRPTKDRPVLDATASTTEVLADAAMSGDLIASIPVVGIAIKALRARDSFRDALFAEKLVEFIRNLSEIPETRRREMRERFDKDEDARAAGATLLLVLERLTDFEKPALLAFLLKCFAEEQIDAKTLRRLATAVDVAFSDDLRDFLTLDFVVEGLPARPEHECLGRLVASGLTSFGVGVTWKSDGDIVHFPSPLGETLRGLVQHADGDLAPSRARR